MVDVGEPIPGAVPPPTEPVKPSEDLTTVFVRGLKETQKQIDEKVLGFPNEANHNILDGLTNANFDPGWSSKFIGTRVFFTYEGSKDRQADQTAENNRVTIMGSRPVWIDGAGEGRGLFYAFINYDPSDPNGAKHGVAKVYNDRTDGFGSRLIGVHEHRLNAMRAIEQGLQANPKAIVSQTFGSLYLVDGVDKPFDISEAFKNAFDNSIQSAKKDVDKLRFQYDIQRRNAQVAEQTPAEKTLSDAMSIFEEPKPEDISVFRDVESEEDSSEED